MSMFWRDGQLVREDETRFSPTLFSLNYAVCGFEGIRSYQTGSVKHVFRLHDHVSRFISTCEYLGIESKYLDSNFLIDSIVNIVSSSESGDLYIRPIAYFDEGIMNLKDTPPAVVSIFAQQFQPKSSGELSIEISGRVRDVSTIARKISRNYFDSYMALRSKSQDYDEVLMLSSNGLVTETSAHNIFFELSSGEIVTPSLDYCLPGITRDCVITLLSTLKIPVSERAISIEELSQVTSAAICSTASEMKIVKKIGEWELRTHKTLFETVKLLLQDSIHGDGYLSKEWNKYV